MKPERRSVQYGAHVIEFSVVRRDRRTLEIAVEPDASVRIAAPIGAADEAIDAKIRRRAAWIIQQQRYFSQFLPRTPDRRYVTGETHLYLGRQYRLKIIVGELNEVKMARGWIVAQSRDPDNASTIRSLVDGWYRARAHVKFADRIELNLHRFPDPDSFRPTAVIIRLISQRWGSMSPSRRLLLNLRLIEAPIDAIDYVITHELCHIAEPNHAAAFFELLTRVMPDWPKRKQRLETIMA